MFSVTAVYFCSPMRHTNNLGTAAGNHWQRCLSHDKDHRVQVDINCHYSDQIKLSKEWLGIPGFNSLAKSLRAAASISPGVQWTELIGFPDIETGELFQPEVDVGFWVLGENCKHFPVCCWCTLNALEDCFITNFSFTPSSHLTSLLLPIQVEFSVKLMYFCQHTQRRQSKQ